MMNHLDKPSSPTFGRSLAPLKLFCLICLVILTPIRLHAQAIATASRSGDLQIGASYNFVSPDCPELTSNNFKGYGFYATFDFKRNFGVEAEFHQANDPNAVEGLYERTYEIGPRYVRHYGRLAPYAKAMYGRGVFNFPRLFDTPAGQPIANIAYNIFAGGVGADYRLIPAINIRVEYEIQQWTEFPDGLRPRLLTVGAAYHFH